MSTFDQQTFNTDVARTLGEHTSKLDTLLERTAELPKMATKVDRHDTELKAIKRVGSILGVGIVSTVVAFVKSKFFPHTS